MREGEIYLEQLNFLSTFLEGHLAEVPDDKFYQRPLEHMNPIGFIYWHLLRLWDYDLCIAKEIPLTEGIWYTGNYVDKGGYNPEGIGLRGGGMGMGYTDADVDAMRIPREVLSDYHQQILQQAQAFLPTVADETLRAERPHPIFEGQMITATERCQHTIAHSYMHIGEIRFIKGIFGMSDPSYPKQ